MTTFTTSKGTFLAVDVPTETMSNLELCENTITYIDISADEPVREVSLPTNHTYEIIGIAGELTEAQCIEIVDYIGDDKYRRHYYEDYQNHSAINSGFLSTIVSFASLCIEHNIPSTHLIIKQTT